jgi:hypothetical protein
MMKCHAGHPINMNSLEQAAKALCDELGMFPSPRNLPIVQKHLEAFARDTVQNTAVQEMKRLAKVEADPAVEFSKLFEVYGLPKNEGELRRIYAAGFHSGYHAYKEKLAKVEEINRRACEDWADDDTRVKELAKPFFTELQINGDSYGVPGVVDIAELFATRLAKVEDEKRELVRALQELRDCQNGPPLETERWIKAWNHAMELANKALDKAALAKGEAKPSEDRQ